MKYKKVDEFIPFKEMTERAKEEAKVTWHDLMKCPTCGDKMFWSDTWDKWICRSWIYMDGGCP